MCRIFSLNKAQTIWCVTKIWFDHDFDWSYLVSDHLERGRAPNCPLNDFAFSTTKTCDADYSVRSSTSQSWSTPPYERHAQRGVDSPTFSNDWRLISRTKFKNLLGKHTVHDWFPGLIPRFKIFANLKKVDFLGEKNKNKNNFQNLERCCWHTTLHSWFLICGRNETGRKVLTGRATVTSELIIGKSKQQCMHEWRKVLLKGFWSQCVTARFLPQFSASLEI